MEIFKDRPPPLGLGLTSYAGDSLQPCGISKKPWLRRWSSVFEITMFKTMRQKLLTRCFPRNLWQFHPCSCHNISLRHPIRSPHRDVPSRAECQARSRWWMKTGDSSRSRPCQSCLKLNPAKMRIITLQPFILENDLIEITLLSFDLKSPIN